MPTRSAEALTRGEIEDALAVVVGLEVQFNVRLVRARKHLDNLSEGERSRVIYANERDAGAMATVVTMLRERLEITPEGIPCTPSPKDVGAEVIYWPHGEKRREAVILDVIGPLVGIKFRNGDRRLISTKTDDGLRWGDNPHPHAGDPDHGQGYTQEPKPRITVDHTR